MKNLNKLLIAGIIALTSSGQVVKAEQNIPHNNNEETTHVYVKPAYRDLTTKVGRESYDSIKEFAQYKFHKVKIPENQFEPRAFWEQPINKILEYLVDEIFKYHIYEHVEDYWGGLFQEDGPYSLKGEEAFENDVEKKMHKFAIENGIDPNSFDFKASLRKGKSLGDKPDSNTRMEYYTPLIAFFDGFILEHSDSFYYAS